jgi:hypothetical protein
MVCFLAALVGLGCGDDAESTTPGTTGGTTPTGTATGTGAGTGGSDVGGGGTGGTGGLGGAGQGGAIPTSYSCTSVGGSGNTDGIFSLRDFDGTLYAGMFGYGHEGESMLFSYPPWQRVSSGIVGIGESVCAMEEYDGQLYANTEDSADIFRSSDGSTWERVHDGPAGYIGCGLAIQGDHIYAIQYDVQNQTHGRILRSNGGSSWSLVYDSGSASRYVREIVSFGGTLYAFAVDQGTAQGYMLTSSGGLSWTETAVGARYFRTHPFGGSLWVSSTSSGSNGVAGIWQFDGTSFTQVHQSAKVYVTDITDWRGALFAATSDGWKNDTGNASVLFSIGGQTWTEICQLGELAAWAIEVSNDRLFVGTWQYQHGGQLYEITPD